MTDLELARAAAKPVNVKIRSWYPAWLVAFCVKWAIWRQKET